MDISHSKSPNVKAESEVNNARDGGKSLSQWKEHGPKSWSECLNGGTGSLCVPQEQGFEMGRTKVKQRRQKPDQDHLTEQWQSEAGRKGERSCCLVGTAFQFCKRHLRNVLENYCPTDWIHLMLQNCRHTNGWESKFYFFNAIFKLLKKWKVINFLKEFWLCLRGNRISYVVSERELRQDKIITDFQPLWTSAFTNTEKNNNEHICFDTFSSSNRFQILALK